MACKSKLGQLYLCGVFVRKGGKYKFRQKRECIIQTMPLAPK